MTGLILGISDISNAIHVYNNCMSLGKASDHVLKLVELVICLISMKNDVADALLHD